MAELGFFKRLNFHVHIAVMLVGGAALRCFVGYILAGEHVREGATFDYASSAAANKGAKDVRGEGLPHHGTAADGAKSDSDKPPKSQ